MPGFRPIFFLVLGLLPRCNLVGNAIKFTDTGAIDVTLELTDLPDARVRLKFSVSDTGRGIPAEELGQIFDTFTQTSTTDTEAGTGLGLSICRKLVGLYVLTANSFTPCACKPFPGTRVYCQSVKL